MLSFDPPFAPSARLAGLRLRASRVHDVRTMKSSSEFQDGKLLRIFVDEGDRVGAQPAYTAIVELLRRNGIAGATVFRGIEGFGSTGNVHLARPFSMLPKLPILIEVVDDWELLEPLLPRLQELVGAGLITLEAARYLRLEGKG